MVTKTNNQEKAPVCAAFVESLRQVFGADQVKVLYVSEASVELGEKQESLEEYYQRLMEELLAAKPD